MKRKSRAVAALAPALGQVRRLAMLAVLLAFAFQAYALQTHLHGKPLAAAPVHALKAAGPAKQLPVDPLDPATCKLCQELIHSGAALTPGGPAFAVLLDWAVAVAPATEHPADSLPPQTGWQGRAPPRR